MGVGNSSGAPSDQDGARSLHTLNFGTGLSATNNPYVVISMVLYVPAGSTVTLDYTGTPTEGYELGGYSAATADGDVTDTAISGDAEDGYTLTMPATNVTVSAAFTPIEYAISYDLDGGSVDGENPTAYTIESAPISLHRPDKAGDTFAGRMGTGLTEPILDVVIPTGSTGDHSYTAHWTQTDYTVSQREGDWEFIQHGAVTPSQTENLHYGDTVTLTVTPEAGYALRDLLVTDAGGSPVATTPGENNTYTFLMPASDVFVDATFAELHTVTIDSGITGGTVAASPTVAFEGETITISVTPEAGYSLGGLYVNSEDIGWSTSFEMPNEDVTIRADFEMFWASLNAAMKNGGSFTLPYDLIAAYTDTPLTVPEGVTVTLDLNGHARTVYAPEPARNEAILPQYLKRSNVTS